MRGSSYFEKPDDDRIREIRKQLEKDFYKPLTEKELQRLLPGILHRSNDLIYLTKLNDVSFVLNAELIETMEATPDTVITLVNGRKYIAKESVDEVRQRCIDYKQQIYNREI